MKIIKRGQLAMLSIAFMIMIAGYINYKYNPQREESLGQTVKVNSGEVYLYSNNNNVNLYKEASVTTDKNENIYNSKNETSSLESFKASRDNMFSELEQNYTTAMSKSNSSNEIKMYQDKLDEVVKKKHIINIVEGILKAKGISDIVIVPTDEKYNVMIKLEKKLTEAQVSMIQKIIEEEFGVDAARINIIEE